MNDIKIAKKSRDLRTPMAVVITILVCATIAALGYFYILNVRKSYLKGVSEGLNVKSVQDLQAIIVR